MKEYSIIKNAIDNVFESEIDSYISTVDLLPDHEFSQEFNDRFDKIISKQKRHYYKFVCTAGRRAACIIGAILILSASSLSVKAVRDAVSDFFMKVFSDHTEVAVDADVSDVYPDTIEKEYYIDALPDGFEKNDYYSDNSSVHIIYIKGSDFISFAQYTKDSFSTNLDNEHSEITKTIDENGQEYLIRESDDSVTVIWDNGEYIFRIGGNLNKKEAIELCNSTKIKE